MKLTVCDTKTLYDTEFEAIIAAAKKSYRFDQEMVPYACYGHGGVSKPHWHLTHIHPHERSGSGKGYKKCINCGELFKRGATHQCDLRALANGRGSWSDRPDSP